MFWLLDQRVEEKLRRAFHRGVDSREVMFIIAEQVMLPELLTQPRAAHRPHPVLRPVHRRGCAPDVNVVMSDPAARAPMKLRRARASVGHLQYHLRERFGA